ncbi:MAG: dienelactone hydrolase family protein [Acidobacteria bacterium]|nr:dienelactone hydrolase family protein [Acidobacteriota bacterium]
MTDKPHLETLEVEPAGPADASVIWMHGLGADANDFYGIPPQLGLPAELRVRYVFPNAPRIPVTINGGLIMRAWYDVYGFDARDQDERRIRQSAGWLDDLVAREVERGVAARRVVLAGFSQGGAMALFAGLRHPEALAGLMCLSAYLPLPDTLAAEASAANRSVPVFQAHGTADPMVPADLGRGSRDRLVEAGCTVEYHEYPMAHQVCADEVRDIGSWLTGVLTRD